MEQIRSADELVKRAVITPGLMDKIKADPATELQKLASEVVREVPATPLQTDRWIYRLVVGALGLVILVAIIGAILLAWKGQTTTPDILTAIGSAAVGALAGLLAPSPTSPKGGG